MKYECKKCPSPCVIDVGNGSDDKMTNCPYRTGLEAEWQLVMFEEPELSIKSATTDVFPIDTPEGRIGWELRAPIFLHKKKYTPDEWTRIERFVFEVYRNRQCNLELRV